MRVYVVISGYDYGDIGADGVFTSKEKAEQYGMSLNLDEKFWCVEEFDLDME